jgi:hypothetical protein
MHVFTFSFLFLLILLICLPAGAQRTLNHGIHAVPAPTPGKVVMDGNLSEWDTSGSIVCCKDVESMIDTESAKVVAMWDKDNLYLGVTWRDRTPMVNNVDPVTMPGNGWRSDCVQFRFFINDFVSHVDAWYYTLGKLPAMSIHYGRMGTTDGGQPKVDRPAPMKMGAEQIFKLSPDGKGYVQEIKIPWAVLTLDGKMPPKGSDLRVGLELFWGDVAGDGWPRSRVTDNLMDGETQTDFFWTNVKAWGKLVIEEKGNLQLPLPAWLAAKPVEPQGPVPITFTLTKDACVTIAIEDAKGNREKSLVGGVKYPKGKHTIYWSGLDDRDQILPAGNYKWVGISRDELNVKWKMDFYQPNTERPWPTADGTGGWGPDHGTLMTAAAGGGLVYLAGIGSEGGYPFFATDENGKKIWSQKSGEPDHLAYADGIIYGYTSAGDSNWLGITPRGMMQFDAATGRWLDIARPDGTITRRLDLLAKDEKSIGFAADKDKVYLSIKDKGMIRSFDRKTFKESTTYTVPDANEIFATADGRIIAATPTTLVELNLATKAVRTLVTGDFKAVRGVTADNKGNFYISLGAPKHQVMVYKQSGEKTKLARVIGKDGGRPVNGWYKPKDGFHNPTGLAVDGKGQLWVVEQGYKPKRVSVWKSGTWKRDFIGDTYYGGGGVINPLDPTMAFYKDMQFKIDLDKGTSKLVQIGMVMPKNAADYNISYAEEKPETFTGYIIAYKNKAYLINDNPRQIFRQREDGRWTLCVHVDLKEKFAWVDRSDDGIVQENEITRGGKDANWGGMDYWGQRPSQNMDMFFANGDHGLRLKLQSVTPKGTPCYDFTKFETMAGECQNGIGLRDGSYNSGCSGERGEYFSEMRKIYPDGTRKTFWFRGLNTGRWTYRLPEPGVVLYPYQAHGAVDVPSLGGEVICWVSDFGQRYLFTDDMLYIGQLFMDARTNWDPWPSVPTKGFNADKMSPGQESFMGYFTRIKDGRYFVSTGATDCRIFEITGMDSLQRLPGEALTLKPEDLARTREIQEFRATGGKKETTITIPLTAKPMPLDGKLDKWADPAARIKVDDTRNALVYNAYDNNNLYVAWDVRKTTPMVNTAKRWALAFKGGDSVDMMLRLPGEKLENPAVRAGDLRLLITMFEGKPAAVLYRPISDTKKPETFDAFEGAGRTNTVRMDEVRLATEVNINIVRRADGYLVEAAIPWSLLGMTPKPATDFRLDYGVLFSDPAGIATAIRAYWCNKDTNIVVDIPTEATLQPGNWGTGRVK